MNILKSTKTLMQNGTAIDITGTKGAKNNDITIFNDLESLVDFIINLVFGIGLALALVFVIVGGIKYITSQGDQTKAEEARNTITNAVIGAVVVIAFKLILDLALDIIGGGDLSTYLGGGGGNTPATQGGTQGGNQP